MELTSAFVSVALYEVEPGKWFFMFAGNIEMERILASDESLKEALHTVTERSDIKLGDVVYVTDYRQVLPRSQLLSSLTKMVLGRAFGWSTNSARVASSSPGMLLMYTPHAEVR